MQLGKLTNDHLVNIQDTYGELAGLEQLNYGYTDDNVRDELDAFLDHPIR